MTVLGKQVSEPLDEVELIPWPFASAVIELECTEFTSICPVTGQPDFGQITITYVPNKHLIETKSLKLFLQGFRDRKQFVEKLTAEIAARLFGTVKPRELTVAARFNARGGIKPGAVVTLCEEVS